VSSFGSLDWKKKTFRINVIWYNKTMARPKGIPMSEEAKDLIRQFQKGRTRSPETRARMSVAAKLRSEEHYANSRSPEARAKASAKMKGRKPWHSLRPTTEAFRESRRLINLGRPKSIETRLKMAEARRGEKSHLWKGGLRKNTIANAKTPCRLWNTDCGRNPSSSSWQHLCVGR